MFGDVLVFENAPNRILKPVSDVRQLKEFSQGSHQDSCADKQYQHGDSPDETVDGTVYVAN